MIVTLTGAVTDKLDGIVVLDVGGVGYGLTVNQNDYSALTIGETRKLYVYEHIREQVYDLFGFTNLSTRQLLESLLSVKNVGPKVAMAVLGIGSESYVREAIAGGEVKILQGAKGVGKRAAEQIVVELRDKMGLISGDDAEAVVTRAGTGFVQDEAVHALMALGYSDVDAEKALMSIERDLPIEQRVKLALRGKQ